MIGHKILKFGLVPVIAGILHVSASAEPLRTGDCTEADRLTTEAGRYVSSAPHRAESNLRMALEFCGESAAVRYNLAMFHYMRREFSAAKRTLEEALEIDPSFAPALNALAFLLLTEPGGASRAFELAKRAAELDLGNEHYLDTLARVQAAQALPAPTTSHGSTGSTASSLEDIVAVVLRTPRVREPGGAPAALVRREAEAIKEHLVYPGGYLPERIIYISNPSEPELSLAFGTGEDRRGRLFKLVGPQAGKQDVFLYYPGEEAPGQRPDRQQEK